MNPELNEKFLKFLKLYWLRPENGLLATLKSQNLKDMQFISPSLDLSCGDGMWMFIHLGGTFSDQFDYYKSTKAEEFSHDSNIDIFDTYDSNYSTEIISSPEIQIDYGTDWKQSLLDKASQLNIYKNLILHDNNQKLPFENDYFKTIYSNSAYWVKNIELLLSDLRRVLHPEGRLYLQVMTPFHHETLNKLDAILSKEAIDILDRHRRESYLGLKKYHEWIDLFKKSKFKIIDIQNAYPNEQIIDFWNIGFRPISHLLIQMSDYLSSEKRLDIKKPWVDTFFKLLKPLLYGPTTYTFENSPYLLFTLEK